MRITHIDGFRGFFLVSMTIGHISFVTPSIIGKLTHHTWGFLDAAQGFIAFSGLIIGLVYGKRLLNRSEYEMRQSLNARIRALFLWYVILCIAISSFAPLLPNLPEFLIENLGNAPRMAGALAVLQVSEIWGVSVLALYLVFMALTPAALLAMHLGKWHLLAVCSLSAWLLAQSGYPTALWLTLTTASGIDQHGLSLGVYFNRLGWQILYFGGLAIGFQMAKGNISTDFIHSRAGYILLAPCFALISLFYVRSILLVPIPEGHERLVLAAFERRDMNFMRVAVFGSYMYLGLWLLLVGGSSQSLIVRALSKSLDAFARWRPLVFLGQHSLQVFAWQACLTYLFAAFVSPFLVGKSLLLHEVALGLAAMSLFIPALLNHRYRAWRQATLPTRQQQQIT